MLKTTLTAALIVAGVGFAAADPITVHDPYARSSSPVARTGAVFMLIENAGATEDRLIGAETPAADRAELHTHVEAAGGVMRMVKIEDGLAVPAGGSHRLARGGDHVMLMGLTAPLADGDTVLLTLIFERAGEITVDVPVDRNRAPAAGAHSGRGS